MKCAQCVDAEVEVEAIAQRWHLLDDDMDNDAMLVVFVVTLSL